MNLQTVRTTALSLSVAGALMLSTAPSHTQTNHPKQPSAYPGAEQQNNSPNDAEVPHNWTTDQIITATVHQAWVLSGQNEGNFFEIVRQLAEISAHNRNLVLPDDPGAGRRAGEYIKEQAKADHDQLLYDIVDKSVRMTGKPATPETGQDQ